MHIQTFGKLCFLALTLLGGVMAYAQPRCLPVEYQQRNAAQTYLIRMTQVGHTPMGGNEYHSARVDTRGARFQVLKVYLGDINQLKDIENGILEIHCNNASGVDCTVLEEEHYPFQVGQMYVVYDAPDLDGLLTLKLTACPGSWRYIEDEEALAHFESFYPPVWESGVWLAEHRSSDEEESVAPEELQAEESMQENGTSETLVTELPAPMTP